MMTETLDIVIRLQDQSEAPLLGRTLFTVLVQEIDLPLSVHVMLPRFSAEDLRRLRQSLDCLRPLRPESALLFHNWLAADPLFMQAPLLNWAIELTHGRYFALQNVADLLAPGAYAALLEGLRTGNAALAALPLAVQAVEWWGDVVLPVGAPAAAPPEVPHLILLDRSRIASRDLVVKAREWSDQVDFYTSIAARYPAISLPPDHSLGLRQHPL